MTDSNVIQLQTSAFDSFTNFLAGLGGPLDRIVAQRYYFQPQNVQQLEAAYRGDWIARKCVDIPADDSTREWRTWQAANTRQTENLETQERNLQVQQKLNLALKKARLFGGAVVILGVGTNDPASPLRVETVEQGALKYLHVLSRYELSTGPLDRNVLSPSFNQPEYYMVHTGAGPNVRIHPSRVVRLIGNPRIGSSDTDGWGDSVLDSVDDAIKSSGLVTNGVAQMVAEAKLDIIKVPRLTQQIMTDEYREKLTLRFDFANSKKSILNALIMDKEEEWERISANFASLPDILKMYLLIVCGAVDVPAVRFLGQSAVGLNATGESDIRNYYDSVKSSQVNDLSPAINVLDEVLIRSALGVRPPELWYEWDSLWQETEDEKLAKSERKAKIYQVDVIAGLIPETALRIGRENQLKEDGTYPGFEEALEEAEREAEEVEEEPESFDPFAEEVFAEEVFAEEDAEEEGGEEVTDAAEFEEQEHPRGFGGRFSEKASGSEGEGGRAPEGEGDVVPRWQEKRLREQAASLSKNEAAAVVDYIDSGLYEPLNAYLRGVERAGDVPEEFLQGDLDEGYVNQVTSDLDSAIAKSSLGNRTSLYRGVSQDLLRNLKPGVAFKDAAYTSTSLSEEIAREFAGDDGVVMKINAPHTQKALFMDALNDIGQREILLPRGMTFRVRSVRKGVVNVDIV